MDTRAALPSRIALAAVLALAVLALTAVAPPAADAAKRERGVYAGSVLRPLPGHTERGIVHAFARPKTAGIIAILIGLTADPNDPSGNTYGLHLSRQSCAAIQAGPDRPPSLGADLFGSIDLIRDGSSGYLDDTDVVQIKPARLRAAKSMVLVGAGGAVACGRLMEEEGIFYF
jgi:hypothetical protein